MGNYFLVQCFTSSELERRRLLDERNGARVEQQNEEEGYSKTLIHQFFPKRDNEWDIDDSAIHCGSRLQKFWFKGDHFCQGTRQKVLVTEAPLSKKCPLKMKKSIGKLNSLLQKLGRHPLLQPVYLMKYERGKVMCVQPLMEHGSLRDFIHGEADSLSDWSVKYCGNKGQPLDTDCIASIGKTILLALESLYQLGLPPLGHVHTGNIMMTGKEGGCRLGGYENTLLGYQSRTHRLFSEYGNKIDVIAFGHVIYEMSCRGQQLKTALPDNEDYRSVSDTSVSKVLKFIFEQVETRHDHRHIISKILHHEFFESTSVPVDTRGISLSRQEKGLLRKVREGKEQRQKD